MWASLLKLVLSLSDKLAEIFRNERLMDAGKAKAELEGRAYVEELEKKAEAARTAAPSTTDSVSLDADPRNRRRSRKRAGDKLQKP